MDEVFEDKSNTVEFAHSNAFCRSRQNILFVYKDSCKFSLQF